MIPKKPNTNKLKEFRPISLLPTISKILESLIANKIFKWAEDNNVINAKQSGFSYAPSQDNIFEFIQSILQKLNRKQGISKIFIDFEKAFDNK